LVVRETMAKTTPPDAYSPKAGVLTVKLNSRTELVM